MVEPAQIAAAHMARSVQQNSTAASGSEGSDNGGSSDDQLLRIRVPLHVQAHAKAQGYSLQLPAAHTPSVDSPRGAPAHAFQLSDEPSASDRIGIGIGISGTPRKSVYWGSHEHQPHPGAQYEAEEGDELAATAAAATRSSPARSSRLGSGPWQLQQQQQQQQQPAAGDGARQGEGGSPSPAGALALEPSGRDYDRFVTPSRQSQPGLRRQASQSALLQQQMQQEGIPTVGLSARQRAMIGAQQHGAFRFSRVQRSTSGAPAAAFAAPAHLPDDATAEDSADVLLSGAPRPGARLPFHAVVALAATAPQAQGAGGDAVAWGALPPSAFAMPTAFGGARAGAPSVPHLQLPAAAAAAGGRRVSDGAASASSPECDGQLQSQLLPTASHSFRSARSARSARHRDHQPPTARGGAPASARSGAGAIASQEPGSPTSPVALAERRSVYGMPALAPMPTAAVHTHVHASFAPKSARLHRPQPSVAAPQIPRPASTTSDLDIEPISGLDAVGDSSGDLETARLDAELTNLLKEVHEISLRPEIKSALGNLDDRAIKKLYAATARRVEHLPCTPIALSNGSGLLMPLPGPKGVPGYRINHRAQVVPTKAVGHYLRTLDAAPAKPPPGGGPAGPTLMELLDTREADPLSPSTRTLLHMYGPKPASAAHASMLPLELQELYHQQQQQQQQQQQRPQQGASPRRSASGGSPRGPRRRGSSSNLAGSSDDPSTSPRTSPRRSMTIATTARRGSDLLSEPAAFRPGSPPAAAATADPPSFATTLPAPSPTPSALRSGRGADGPQRAGMRVSIAGWTAAPGGGSSSGSQQQQQQQSAVSKSPMWLNLNKATASQQQQQQQQQHGDGGPPATGGQGTAGRTGRSAFSTTAAAATALARSGSNRATPSTSRDAAAAAAAAAAEADPLEARRQRLGAMMAALEAEEVDDLELARYMPFEAGPPSSRQRATAAAAPAAAGPASAPAAAGAGLAAARAAAAAAAAAGRARVSFLEAGAAEQGGARAPGSEGGGGEGGDGSGDGSDVSSSDWDEPDVTDEELGLAPFYLERLPPGSDTVFAELVHSLKRRAALAARRTRLEQEARRRAAEEALRYNEVDLGPEPSQELVSALQQGAREAVLLLKRAGEKGRVALAQLMPLYDTWFKAEQAQAAALQRATSMHPAGAAGSISIKSTVSATAGHGHATAAADGASQPESARHSRSTSPAPQYGGNSSMTRRRVSGLGYGATAADGQPPGGRSNSPGGEAALAAGAERSGHSLGGAMLGAAAGNRTMAGGRVSSVLGGGGAGDVMSSAALAATWAGGHRQQFVGEAQRARLDSLVDGWKGTASPESAQLSALAVFKEALLPSSIRPQPAELKPFAPEPNEPVRLTEQQVERRLAQAEATGEPVLDLDFGPRITKGDCGVLFTAIQGAAREQCTGLRAMGNCVAASGVVGLQALIKSLPHLELLDLRNNALVDAVGAAKLGTLLHPHYRCALRALDLSGCPLGDAGFESLVMSLDQNKTLQELVLRSCGMGDPALMCLERSLQQNSVLQLLDLAGNRFTASGVAQLARDVEDNRSLTALSLSRCSLPDDAAPPLARVLACHPSLRHLDLSHNGLGWRGGRALAAGLAPQPHVYDAGLGLPALVSLELKGNALGQAGLLALMRMLMTNTTLRRVGVDSVPTVQLPGEPLELDPHHPNGHYTLDLANPEHRQAATTLVEIWHASGGSSWVDASLNGLAMHMRPSLDWPARMPAQGSLAVSVRNGASLEPSIITSPGAVLSEGLMACLESAAASESCSEMWKASLLGLATKVAYVSAEQAGRLLRPLRYQRERTDAAAALLSACPDLHRASAALRRLAGFGPDDLAALLQEYGLAHVMPLRSEVLSGWELCCTGPFSLELGLQAQRLLAILLVELAGRQGGASTWSLPPSADPAGELAGVAPPVRLGDATACMRCVAFNGEALDGSVIYLSGAHMPTTGRLTLQFVNLAPRTHVDYVGRGAAARNRGRGGPAGGSSCVTASPSYALSTEASRRPAPEPSGAGAATAAGGSSGGGGGAGLPLSRSRVREHSQMGASPAATAAGMMAWQQPSSGSWPGGEGGGAAGSPPQAAPAAPSPSPSPPPLLPPGGSLYPVPSTRSGVVRRPSMGNISMAPSVASSVAYKEEVLRGAASAFTNTLSLSAAPNKKSWWQPYQTAFENLFKDCLTRLQLPHNHAYLTGWRQASNMWKVAQYRAFSAKLHEAAHARHAAILAEHEERQAKAAREAAEEAAEEGKGGKKGKKGKDKKRKHKHKKGDKDGSGKDGAAAWPPPLDPFSMRSLGLLLTLSRQLLSHFTHLACRSSLSCYQVLHLLRLVPDLDLRIEALVAIWPAIWDRGNIADVILDLDHPVALAPLPAALAATHGSVVGVGATAGLRPHAASGGKQGDAAGHDAHSSPASPHATRVSHAGPPAAGSGASITAGSPHGATHKSPPAAAAAGSSTSAGANAGAGVASVPSSAAPGSAPPPQEADMVVPPKNMVPGPTPVDSLVARVAACLGWRSLLLCWSSPGALQGVTLHLHMASVEQLQAAAAICRFADRAWRNGSHCAVSRIVCDDTDLDVPAAYRSRGGLWGAILKRSMLCLDEPQYGRVALELGGLTQEAQRASAAVLIQGAWRGFSLRRRLYQEQEAAAGGNRWRRCWLVARLLRRLRLMRTLAADLDIARAHHAMEKGYLQMLYGPNTPSLATINRQAVQLALSSRTGPQGGARGGAARRSAAGAASPAKAKAR